MERTYLYQCYQLSLFLLNFCQGSKLTLTVSDHYVWFRKVNVRLFVFVLKLKEVVEQQEGEKCEIRVLLNLMRTRNFGGANS